MKVPLLGVLIEAIHLVLFLPSLLFHFPLLLHSFSLFFLLLLLLLLDSITSPLISSCIDLLKLLRHTALEVLEAHGNVGLALAGVCHLLATSGGLIVVNDQVLVTPTTIALLAIGSESEVVNVLGPVGSTARAVSIWVSENATEPTLDGLLDVRLLCLVAKLAPNNG